MLNYFLIFNGMVLKSFSSMFMLVVAMIFVNLAQVLFLAVFLILLRTLFSSAPFILTPRKTWLKMFEFADIKPGDKVYDLGCGEGRLVFESEARGAHAVGIELNIWIYQLALFNKKRLESEAVFVREDLHKADLSDANVVFCYLMPWAMKKLGPKFKKELKSGCKIVSHGFELPGWRIEKQYSAGGFLCRPVYLYIA